MNSDFNDYTFPALEFLEELSKNSYEIFKNSSEIIKKSSFLKKFCSG